jgi:hypothetical protein
VPSHFTNTISSVLPLWHVKGLPTFQGWIIFHLMFPSVSGPLGCSSGFCFVSFLIFWNRVSLRSVEWPQSDDPSALAYQVLELQMCFATKMLFPGILILSCLALISCLHVLVFIFCVSSVFSFVHPPIHPTNIYLFIKKHLYFNFSQPTANILFNFIWESIIIVSVILLFFGSTGV